MDWLKKAPNTIIITVIIVCGFLAVAVLGAYVYMLANGLDTTQFIRFVQTIGQWLVFPFLGTATVASVQAARSASAAEDQTNGQLTALQQENAALRAQLDARGGGQ